MPSRRTPRVSTRVRRTSPRQGPRAPTHLVERMVVAVIGVVNAYFDRLMRDIEPLLQHRFGGQRSDADSLPVGPIGGQIALGEQFLKVTFKLIDRQAADDLARVAPVSSESLLPNAAELERKWIHANTELIQLDSRAREEIRKVIEGPLRQGATVDEIRKKIQERLGVVRSRAEFIARDQTLKLYGQIQEQRQTAAGIEEYTWSTSQDERVRGNPDGLYPNSQSDHFHLEGTVQRWDSAPVVDAKTGRTAHPGADFQCRCAAIPILPDELEERENPPAPADIEPTPPENDLEPLPANEVGPANETTAAEEQPTPSPSEAAAEVASQTAEMPALGPGLQASQRSPETAALSLTSHYRTVGEVPRASEEVLLRTLADLRPAQTPLLRGLELHEGDAFAVPLPNGKTGYADGQYRRDTRTLKAVASPSVEALPLSDHNWTTGASAKTVADAMARLAAHEYAHHIHFSAPPEVDQAIRLAYEALAPQGAARRVRKEPTHADSPPEGSVSVYGSESPWEFFAEAFVAYHFDGVWMSRNKPGAFALVEEVLRLLE